MNVSHRWRIALLATLACLLASCEATPSPSTKGSLRLGADSATAPLAGALISAYESQHPGLEVSLETRDRAALINVSQGDLVSASILFGSQPATQKFQVPIGRSALALVTGSSPPIRDLGEDQLQSIFRGTTVNWRELGGIDAAIQPIVWPPDSSERLAFDLALGLDGEITSQALLIASVEQLFNTFEREPFALGYAPMMGLDDDKEVLTVNQIAPTSDGKSDHGYLLRVPLVLISAIEPSGELKDFLDWILSPDGQGVVRRYADGVND